MNAPTQQLAPYAVADAHTRGRQYPEPSSSGESPFGVDRRRVMSCMAFRRLTHKTQVFVTDCGDHFRTRLTHTIEVQIQAERLACLLHLNKRLAGAIALAHDLGHPPFGHAGESALAEQMADHGGFEHNLQSLRVVDYLEHPYPSFRGLNLSFELRESLVKHRTTFDRPDAAPTDASVKPLLDTGPQSPLEGQVANVADVVAYTLHDIEDGVIEGVLDEETLARSALWRQCADVIRGQHATAPLASIRRPILDDMARTLHEDAAAESGRRILAAEVKGVDDVRKTPRDLIAFSSQMQSRLTELQGLLVESVYHNHRVVRMDSKARRLIRDLFGAYLAEPQLMPARFTVRLPEQGPHKVICDYIAGMTDRFCQEEHRRLFAPFHFG